MATTLVFDWNGTLFDDTHAILGTVNKMLSHYVRPTISLETLQDLCSFPFSTLYRNLGFTECEITELHANNSAMFHDNYEPLSSKSPLRKGAIELLKLAKKNNLQCIILSNHVTGMIEGELHRLKVQKHFSDILAFASRDTQYKDIPKGERLRLYIKEKSIAPESTVIIGDTIEEREIAEKLNLVSIAITGGVVSEKRLREAKPHHVIHDFFELLPILEKRNLL